MEDRLRAAYQAKAEQVTDRRLAQLRAERASQLATLFSEDVPIARLEHPPVQLDSRRHRHSRWFAPAVAAAAVAAVAAAAFALSQPGSHRDVPAPPASHLSSPSASASPTVTNSPSPTASSSTSVAAAYLPAGQTGVRADVPWSKVGTGWRLVQPSDVNGTSTTLYLYDPAGGRYLITDQLPKQAYFEAWSPDGQRAMFQTNSSGSPDTRFQQLDLQSGQLEAGFAQFEGNFLSYTQPRGLAVIVEGMVQGAPRLLRYSTDGTPQQAYPPTIDGLGALKTTVLYTPDGSQLLSAAGDHVVLLSNGGELVRTYSLPRSGAQFCTPQRWWTSGTFLEYCQYTGYGTLYLQPVDGGQASVLVDRNSSIGLGYLDARPLSNGDALLTLESGCGSAGYDVLHPDGTIVPLRLPVGVPAPGTILNLDGDLATFRVAHGCGAPGSVSLLDYNMVTGKTSPLLNSDGIVRSYPSDN